MHADALTIGQYIKAAEFGNTLPAEPTWTIAGANIEDVPSLKPGAQEGKTVPKGVVFLKDIPRGWVMNKTNVACIKGMFGAETDDWIGKRITLYRDATVKPEPGIRVRGSPDIDREIRVTVKLPKKAPITITLVPTGRASGVTLDQFRGWLQDAVRRGWTQDQIRTLLGMKSDEVPPGERAGIVAKLKAGPPRTEEPPPLSDEDKARIEDEDRRGGGM
jgi:hypothetical protein